MRSTRNNDNMIVYLDKPYVKVFWDPNNGILTSRWSGFCTYDEVRAVGDRIIDAVNFEGVKKVLYDAREIEILDDDSLGYISGDFAKSMIRAGVKYAATVFPEDIIARFSVDTIQERLSQVRGSVVVYYNTLGDASNWLEDKQA